METYVQQKLDYVQSAGGLYHLIERYGVVDTLVRVIKEEPVPSSVLDYLWSSVSISSKAPASHGTSIHAILAQALQNPDIARVLATFLRQLLVAQGSA